MASTRPDGTAPSLSLRLFGPFEVLIYGAPLPPLRSRRAGWILALLALRHSAAGVDRGWLAETLWSDTDHPRANLRTSLDNLRRALGPVAGRLLSPTPRTLALDLEDAEVDVLAFDQAIARGDPASLEAAVALYRGPLLEECFEEWIDGPRRERERAYLGALEELASRALAAGAPRAAEDHLRRLVAVDPLCERSWRMLMQALAQGGSYAAALRAYRDLFEKLRRDLNEAPGPETRALFEEIRTEARQIAQGPRPSTDVRSEPLALHEKSSVRPATVPDPWSDADIPDASWPPAPEGHGVPFSSPPTGTVTFLLTDIEGHTATWERTRDLFPEARTSHDALLRRLFRACGGYEVKNLGDGFLVAFQRAGDALACAVAGQQSLAAHGWPKAVGPLRVRMALHTGDVEPHEGDYHTLVVNHAARILAAGHGGQVLCSEETATLLRRDLPPGVRLTDLGVYRLRDVSMPARLFQVGYPGMQALEFPPLRAEPGYASHLPPRFTGFVGREEEIVRLRELLLSARVRVVTLTGTGGSGKTRLSLEAASRLVDEWHGAVWFVPLADLSEAWLLPTAIGGALRLPRTPDEAPLDQVVAELARQPTLLVLDSVEHLLPAGASIVRTLLGRAPSLTGLVTSRARLNLAGEREFPVSPLPTPAGPGTPEQLLGCESVQLFVERAQEARPDFQLTPDNAAAVAALCRRLEGLPLALELAAVRVTVLTPAQILAYVEQSLDILITQQVDIDPRHRSLRATLDWSYRLLSSELQRLFARLSIFRGGWSLVAAEVVCREEDVRPVDRPDLDPQSVPVHPPSRESPGRLNLISGLEQLRQGSLVLAEAKGGEIRFRMLEPVREYARERLDLPEQTDLQRRHFAYCLDIAEQTEAAFPGPEEERWLDRLELEHENLRTAIAWSIQAGEVESGLRLAGVVWPLWCVRGHWIEGLECVSRLLKLPRAATPSAARAKALHVAGQLAYCLGDPLAGQAFFEESLALWRTVGDRSGLVGSLNNLGDLLLHQGYPESARPLFQEGLTIARELSSSSLIVWSLNNLGQLHHVQGEYEAARVLLEEGLAIARKIGEQRTIAGAISALGRVATEQGDYRAARTFCEEGLAIRRALGYKSGVVSSLNDLGRITLRQGDLTTARDAIQEGLALSRELGSESLIAWCLTSLGEQALVRKEYGEARTHFEEGMRVWQDSGDRRSTANTLCMLGQVALGERDVARASSLFAASLAVRREIGNRAAIAESLRGLAAVAALKRQPARAVQIYGAADGLLTPLGAALSPVERDEQDSQLAALRAELGEEAFAGAWQAGQAQALDEAIAAALTAALPS
jgi:predicted ATPase/DNA-binding SARP family transcriptional activator/class 3 adenylate cyclase